MSLKEAKEEAEAVMDSAEMLIDTFPGKGSTVRKLKDKISKLEQEIQDPDSERSLRNIVEEIKELMNELEDEGMSPDPVGPEEPGVDDMHPDDEMPPF